MRNRHVLVADLLKNVLPNEARNRIYGIGLVERRWEEAVGDELARRVEPDKLYEGVLTVRVTDAVWGRMILKLAPRVVTQLNRALGAKLVHRINFKTVSQLSAERRPVKAKPEPLPPAVVTETIVRAAAGIPDAELRELVSGTAARYLARQNERQQKKK